MSRSVLMGTSPPFHSSRNDLSESARLFLKPLDGSNSTSLVRGPVKRTMGLSFSFAPFFHNGKDTGKKSEMGLLGRLPLRIFLLKESAQRTPVCPRFLEGRQLLILVDRVDIEWKKSSSPSGGRRYCCAVANCKVVCLSQEPETGGTPSSRYLGSRLAPNRNRHHDQPGGALGHHACDDPVYHSLLLGADWEET